MVVVVEVLAGGGGVVGEWWQRVFICNFKNEKGNMLIFNIST